MSVDPEDPDIKMINRHTALLARYEKATIGEILQDMYFLSQLAMFRQSYQERLAALHVERGNAACICRTEGCGHTADLHPGGICDICQKACWS